MEKKKISGLTLDSKRHHLRKMVVLIFLRPFAFVFRRAEGRGNASSIFISAAHENDRHHNPDLCLVKSFQCRAKSCFLFLFCFFLLRVYLLPARREEKKRKKKE